MTSSFYLSFFFFVFLDCLYISLILIDDIFWKCYQPLEKGELQWIRVNFRSSTNALVQPVTLIAQLRALSLIDCCYYGGYIPKMCTFCQNISQRFVKKLSQRCAPFLKEYFQIDICLMSGAQQIHCLVNLVLKLTTLLLTIDSIVGEYATNVDI